MKAVKAVAMARPLSPLEAAAEARHIGLLLLLSQGDPLDLLNRPDRTPCGLQGEWGDACGQGGGVVSEGGDPLDLLH